MSSRRRTADALVGMAALQKGLSELRSVEGSRKEILERELAAKAAEVAELCRSPIGYGAADRPPPKSIALAMGLALHSQPHLAVTLGPVSGEGTEKLELGDPPPPEAPVVRPSETLRDALGLQDWELDDLREEVDRRAGRIMKQRRALTWLWRHFGLPQSAPEPLFRHLFPGISGRLGEIGLHRRGAQLYAVLDQGTTAEDTLYLTWRSQGESGARAVGTFRGRYVAEALRASLARAVGASEEEVVHILDHMVAIVPRSAAGRFLAHDCWRVRGAAAITGLASPYPSATWLEGRVWPEAIPTEAWMSVEDGKLTVRRPRAVFDKLALIRTTVMMRQVYGELLGRYCANPQISATDPCMLPLYELGHHLRGVLRPVLDWAADPHTAKYLATKLEVDEEESAKALAEIHAAWEKQANSVWWGLCESPDHPTVQGNLALHLMATATAMTELLSRPPEPGVPHRDLLLLFLGHYFANAPIQRLWTKTDSPPEIDPVGRYFWGTWQRVIDTSFETDSATWTGPPPKLG